MDGQARQVGWLAPPISARELDAWAGFERVHGPIVLGERIDLAAALIAVTVASAAGAKAKFTDFIPKWDPEAPSETWDPDAIRETIEGLAGKRYPDADQVHTEPPAKDRVGEQPRGRGDDGRHR